MPDLDHQQLEVRQVAVAEAGMLGPGAVLAHIQQEVRRSREAALRREAVEGILAAVGHKASLGVAMAEERVEQPGLTAG